MMHTEQINSYKYFWKNAHELLVQLQNKLALRKWKKYSDVEENYDNSMQKRAKLICKLLLLLVANKGNVLNR